MHSPDPMRTPDVADDPTEARKIARAQSLWTSGDRRAALESLKTAIHDRPDSLALRLTLAGLYRELGCPDQAGRWGISIDGWTTPVEQDRLARLLASSEIGRAKTAKFLSLPSARIETYPAVEALLTGPVAHHRKRLGVPGETRSTPTSQFFRTLSGYAWTSTVILIVLGLFGVFGHALFDRDDPAGLARIVGLSCASLGNLSLLLNSAAALAERRWTLGLNLGLAALLLGGLSTTTLIRLLTS